MTTYQHPAQEKVESFLKSAKMEVYTSDRGEPTISMNGKSLNLFKDESKPLVSAIVKKLGVDYLAVKHCLNKVAEKNAEPWGDLF